MESQLTFNQCTLPLLDKTFGLRLVLDLPPLSEWFRLSQTSEIAEMDRFRVADLQELLLNNIYNWNEQELSLHFIGPIFSMVKLGEPYRYNLFA
jgi:hypothetical protein